jgi:DNA-binding SARP family transcriptional activator
MDSQVRFRILGPLEVAVDGRLVPLRGARQERALATLLVDPGRVATFEHLSEAVWDDPPASARRQLQDVVTGLRRTLTAHGARPDLIVTLRAGYVLRLASNELDAYEFEQLVAAAREASETQPPAAARALRGALALYRGRTLAGINSRTLESAVARWEERRLAVTEECLAMELTLGRHNQLVEELVGVVGEHPLRERLVELLMVALHRSGRSSEALDAYQRLRHRLSDETGLDPGAGVRELHRTILRGEAELTPEPALGPEPIPADPSTVPRELPPDPVVFTGRELALGLLDESLPAPGRPARPVVICGMGGVGKSTLAVHWAHRVAERFPDGQLYLHLRGYAVGVPMRPVEALGLLLRALGVPPARVPVDLDAATGMCRTLLANRRVLLVLDNARDADQVRPLLPSAEGCLVLVTSRDRLTGLVVRDGARRITVDPLAPVEAAELVSRLLDGTDPPAAAALATACGRLPLAIRIAAAHLADRPGLTVAAYVAALNANLDGLEVDGDPEVSVRATFAHSYRALDPAARRLFRLLGLVPGTSVTVPAVAALAGTGPDRAQPLLDTLTREHLVEPCEPGRYLLHDLLRAYAAEQAREGDGTERDEAAGRLHQFYLSAMDAAARMLYPRAARLPVDVPDGFPYRTRFPDEAAATAWIDAELTNLVALVEHAATSGPHRVSWLLANALGGYFWLRARYGPQWLATAEAGLAAATAGDDRQAMAACQLSLAAAHRSVGGLAEAIGYATSALALSRQLGWRRGETGALANLGSAHAELGQNQPALAAFDEALAVNREIASRAGEAGQLSNRSGLRFRMGQLREALRDGSAALAIYREIRDPSGEANAQHNIAMCYVYLGELDRAHHLITQSLELFQSIGERYSQSLVRSLLTKLHCDAGRYSAALECGTSTLRDALRAEYLPSAALLLVDLAEVRRQLGDCRDAVRDCAQAVQLARRANHRNALAYALLGLAEAYLHDGQLERATESIAAVRQLIARFGYRRLEGHALTVLGEVHLAAGQRAAAAERGEAALVIHHETGYRLGEARSRQLLAQCVPDHDAARRHRHAAQAILAEVGVPQAVGSG